MNKGDSFSISFHQGKVDFPYDLKIHVNQISNGSPEKCSYRFIAYKQDNQNNLDSQFISAFFTALTYLQNDANFSGLKFEYLLPDENQKDIYFERIAHLDNPIFDSLLVGGYIGEDEVVITNLSCPPQRVAHK
jgi:hypothetical protein